MKLSSPADFSLLKNRYRSLRLVEISMLAIGTGLLTYGLASLWVPVSLSKISISILSGIVVFAVRTVHYKLFKLKDEPFARYLNANYPTLRDSADLLLRNGTELTALQQLQKIETERAFIQLYPSIALPHHIKQATLILVGCVTAFFFLTTLPISITKPGKQLSLQRILPAPLIGDTSATTLQYLSIQIAPLSYMLRKAYTVTNPHLTIPEGSSVTWNILLSGQANDVRLFFAGRDSVNFLPNVDGSYSLQQSITASGFYQLHWSDPRGRHRSDYYEIKVTEDQPPTVTITNLPQFTTLRLSDKLTVDLTSSLRDDYGVIDANVIATVSKGSGESVKFREEKLPFTTPTKISGTNLRASLSFNLLKLGLEPGDELYFYVQALDNKYPTPNYSRTETFFISLQDTTTEIITADAGLGVDLMPEYFRSQRQIIIDTEKLLREKRKLTKQTFNSTSNELGYDQKVLRLRYGQFLGEEADSGIGQQATEHTDESGEDDKDKDPTKEFAHKHDTENEHNLVDKQKDHDHEGEVKNPDEKEDPLKEFMHVHDNTDEATFFIQSVKAKLKAALTLMWDAELYLRLYEPAKSLPYQYKILTLLKEISNDSRIYVHRTGFDPPPLKEDKRLTGDLMDVKNSIQQYSLPMDDSFAAIREALNLTERMLDQDSYFLSALDQQLLRRAGQELATVAMEQPGQYLKALSLIQTILEGKVKPENSIATMTEIRKAFWTALPHTAPAPSRLPATTHALDQTFLNNLEIQQHE